MNQTLGNSKNVLITGGAGFIGSHLARQLVADGHRVTSLDLRDPNEAVTGVEYVRGDVLDRALVDRLVVAKTNIVFHLQRSSASRFAKPIRKKLRNKFFGTMNVLESIRENNIASESPIGLVFASTAAVYGTNGDREILSSKTRFGNFSPLRRPKTCL